MANTPKKLPESDLQKLIETLKKRFEENFERHINLQWNEIEARLKNKTEKIWSLNEMEVTGGEPDVVGIDKKSGEIIFMDCSAETPVGRRKVCYDREALDSRKAHKPETSAIEMAKVMGIELLTEEQYFQLQQLGKFDTKTSSWIKTPAGMRNLGGALFGDRRFERVFIYHNGADSYYGVRGFRGILKV